MKKSCVNLLVLFAILGIAKATYSDCGSEVGSILSLEISGCDNADAKCILHRNTNATFKLQFSTKEDVEKVKAVVHGVVMDVPVPFALPNDDGCVDSGLTCPLKSGGTYSYQTSLPVLKKYPRLTVDVKWELQDENGKDIVCALIPSKIQ